MHKVREIGPSGTFLFLYISRDIMEEARKTSAGWMRFVRDIMEGCFDGIFMWMCASRRGHRARFPRGFFPSLSRFRTQDERAFAQARGFSKRPPGFIDAKTSRSPKRFIIILLLLNRAKSNRWSKSTSTPSRSKSTKSSITSSAPTWWTKS